MSEVLTPPVSDLKQRWTTFQQENPNGRIRNAAAELGVSEAELVATDCGDTVVRLDADWGVLLQEVESLGEVMALTRNDACVHEKHGVYHDVKLLSGHRMGLITDENIDLRLFFRYWHFGFAVATPWDGGKDGFRRSLQFFDKDGTAIHKIFLTRKSNDDAYFALVEKYRHADQTPEISVSPREKDAETPDAELDVAGFLKDWRGLQDTHDFFPMLRTYKVGRTQALRLGEGEFTERVAVTSARAVLDHAAAAETPIMVFVGSPGCVQIHTGPVKKLVQHGPWYNVLDPGFNLHLNETHITDAWIVRKPTEDGVVTSVEVFDADGELIVQFFGKRKPGLPEMDEWREIVAGLPRL